MKETLHVLMFCSGFKGHRFIFKCIIYAQQKKKTIQIIQYLVEEIQLVQN